MTKSYTRIGAYFTFVLALVVAGAVFNIYRVANAGPATVCRDTTNDNSTSTTVSMSPGVGVTTLALSNCASGNLAESAFVQFQFSATTTAKLNIRVEHSNNKVDWYPDTTVITGNATTTVVAGDSLVYQFNLSTTTDNGGSGTAGRLHRSLSISTPTKYTRVVFFVPTGGGSGALWAEVIGRKQF